MPVPAGGPPPARAPDCDVLVCGLGPVGQLLANLLGAAGVRCLAVDAADGPYDLPRAAVIDDEVLRILQSVGLDVPVLAQAQAQDGASYVTAGGRAVAIVRAGARPLGHPPLVTIHQPSMEATLVAALAARTGVQVRWGTRVEALAQDHEGVSVQVRAVAGGPTQTLRSRWLVGCDGAASTVRSLLGIPFTGSTFVQRWLVADALVDRPLARVPHPCFVGDAERPLVTLPMSPGRHRWEWMLHPGEPEAPLLDRQAIAGRIAPWLDGERAQLERAVIYTYHARAAERWRDGRILLAGDAAHVMPPFAGQGFSSGARDAANLAWKLAGVLAGAPPELLDSYEAERRPHAAAMARLAVGWGAVVQTTRPRAARLRDRGIEALDGTRAHAWATRHAKPLPTYGHGAFARSPRRVAPWRVVGSLFPQPTAGGVPLDDVLGPGWTAIAPDGRVAQDLRAGGLAVHAVDRPPDWMRRRHLTWVVLRPDRFVFAAGGRGEPVDAALAALRRTLGDSLRSHATGTSGTITP